jgi:hypothetical protein
MRHRHNTPEVLRFQFSIIRHLDEDPLERAPGLKGNFNRLTEIVQVIVYKFFDLVICHK